MNIQTLKEQFDRDGYIVLENFFDEKLMDHLDGLIRITRLSSITTSF
jgi:hypothetical protein